MSRWTEPFEQHPIHTAIGDISERINAKFDGIDADGWSEIRRMRKVVSFFEETLKGFDAELVSSDFLDALNNEIQNQNILGHLTEYQANKDKQHLINANDCFDSVLHNSNFAHFFAIAKKSRITKPQKTLEKAIDDLAHIVSLEKGEFQKGIDDIDNSLKEKDERLEELSNSINANQQQANELSATWQTQYSEEQGGRNSAFETEQTNRTNDFDQWKQKFDQETQNQITNLINKATEELSERQTELASGIKGIFDSLNEKKEQLGKLSKSIEANQKQADKLLATWEKQYLKDQGGRNSAFTTEQARRTKDFDQWKKEFDQEAENQIKVLINKVDEELNEKQKEFDNKLDSFMKDADEKHEAILRLHGLVAGESVAAGYAQTANKEEKQADLWRWLNIGFIISTAVWVIYVYLFDTDTGADGEFLWGKFFKAFSLTGILLFGAGYSARQSDSHRQNARRAKWFALEVNAINPFISSLSPDDQNSLIKELSSRMFGRQFNEAEKKESLVDRMRTKKE